MKDVGVRVGAILEADESTVKLLGYGTYEGDEVPPAGFLHDIGRPNPKIVLDNGDTVWGFQCWWGAEEKVKQAIGTRRVINVRIDPVTGEESI